MRARNTTAPQPTLPPNGHPIWGMGYRHVAAAHALCCAFAAFAALAGPVPLKKIA
jgi:hypothetical protein